MRDSPTPKNKILRNNNPIFLFILSVINLWGGLGWFFSVSETEIKNSAGSKFMGGLINKLTNTLSTVSLQQIYVVASLSLVAFSLIWLLWENLFIRWFRPKMMNREAQLLYDLEQLTISSEAAISEVEESSNKMFSALLRRNKEVKELRDLKPIKGNTYITLKLINGYWFNVDYDDWSKEDGAKNISTCTILSRKKNDTEWHQEEIGSAYLYRNPTPESTNYQFPSPNDELLEYLFVVRFQKSVMRRQGNNNMRYVEILEDGKDSKDVKDIGVLYLNPMPDPYIAVFSFKHKGSAKFKFRFQVRENLPKNL